LINRKNSRFKVYVPFACVSFLIGMTIKVGAVQNTQPLIDCSPVQRYHGDMVGGNLHIESNGSQPYIEGKIFRGFIGTSGAMQDVYDKIEHAAPSSATVFITGESGTGKEVCAEAIHTFSDRSQKPFIAVNCALTPGDLLESELFGSVKAAIPGSYEDKEGLVKQADGGTLFLDQVCEMCADVQSKLLRFLQNGTFQKAGGTGSEKTDVRIICATNHDPQEEITSGRFREDLYYRLYVVPIHMPTLRDRDEDVIDIALTLLRQYTIEERKFFQAFSDDAEYMMRHYNWPGNVRQLQNVIRNIVVMHDEEVVTADLLPSEIRQEKKIPDNYGWLLNPALSLAAGKSHLDDNEFIRSLAESEREIIEHAINYCSGNIPRAAALLQVAPSTIYRKKGIWEKQDREWHTS